MNVTTGKYDACLGCAEGWGSKGSVGLDSLLGTFSKSFRTRVSTVSIATNAALIQMGFFALKLRRMDSCRALIVADRTPSVEQAIADFRRNHCGRRDFPLILCLTDASYIYATDSLAYTDGAVISRDSLERILEASDPLRAFQAYVVRKVPFQNLVPYTTTLPVCGHMFYGRSAEIEMLKHQEDVCFALHGPGSSGKTSLLSQVSWQLRTDLNPRAGRIVYVDLSLCKPDFDEISRKIASTISPTHYAHYLEYRDLDVFFRRVRHDARFLDGPIDLQVDEVDEAMKKDQQSGYPLLRILRHAIHQGNIRLTIVGRSTPEEIASDTSNPFGSRICNVKMGPLTEKDARDLFLVPLKDLGIQIDNETQVIEKVLGESKYYPSRIQMWGLAICNRVGGKKDRRLTESDLKLIDQQLGLG